jgi:hypothetical protein
MGYRTLVRKLLGNVCDALRSRFSAQVRCVLTLAAAKQAAPQSVSMRINLMCGLRRPFK